MPSLSALVTFFENWSLDNKFYAVLKSRTGRVFELFYSKDGGLPSTSKPQRWMLTPARAELAQMHGERARLVEDASHPGKESVSIDPASPNFKIHTDAEGLERNLLLLDIDPDRVGAEISSSLFSLSSYCRRYRVDLEALVGPDSLRAADEAMDNFAAELVGAIRGLIGPAAGEQAVEGATDQSTARLRLVRKE